MLGRPTKLTSEITERIVADYRPGGDLSSAARRAGIARSTLFTWLQPADRAPAGPFRQLLDAL